MLQRYALSPMPDEGIVKWAEGAYVLRDDIPGPVLTALDAGHGEALAVIAEALPGLLHMMLDPRITSGPWEVCLGSGNNVCTGVNGMDPLGRKPWMVCDFDPDWFTDERGSLRKFEDHRGDMDFVVALANLAHKAYRASTPEGGMK